MMVGKTGFEPATPWSQTRCSTKLSHFPKYGVPGETRTPNLLIRSQTLYPIELRAQYKFRWSGRRDSNSRPQPWQGCALPTELRPQCGAGEGSRTPTPKALDPKSSASASSATPAYLINGEPYWTRTSDTLIKSQVLYRLS